MGASNVINVWLVSYVPYMLYIRLTWVNQRSSGRPKLTQLQVLLGSTICSIRTSINFDIQVPEMNMWQRHGSLGCGIHGRGCTRVRRVVILGVPRAFFVVRTAWRHYVRSATGHGIVDSVGFARKIPIVIEDPVYDWFDSLFVAPGCLARKYVPIIWILSRSSGLTRRIPLLRSVGM